MNLLRSSTAKKECRVTGPRYETLGVVVKAFATLPTNPPIQQVTLLFDDGVHVLREETDYIALEQRLAQTLDLLKDAPDHSDLDAAVFEANRLTGENSRLRERLTTINTHLTSREQQIMNLCNLVGVEAEEQLEIGIENLQQNRDQLQADLEYMTENRDNWRAQANENANRIEAHRNRLGLTAKQKEKS